MADNSATFTKTTFEQADAIATQLASRKDAWLQVSLAQRIDYLQQCVAGVGQVAAAWAEAACLAKGIDPATNLAGEEWLLGPAATLANLQGLITALKAGGQPKPSRITTRNGQIVAQVFPGNWVERLLFLGFTGEVWMQLGKPLAQGRVYRAKPEVGQVALVLGAGNVSAIAPMDALYKLFAEDAVVLLKMNPVNQYIGPFLATAFASLRQAGFLEIVYGDAELGSYLCQHSLVDTIHITGSHHTHDAIVWGSNSTEQAERKAANQPLNHKPITSELGCVTPVLVVPGVWSKSDLAFQARQIAGMVANNASFNCAAAKVLVMAKGWAHREAFLEQVQQELAKTPARQAYYPGAQERYAAFMQRYPQAKVLGDGSSGQRETGSPSTTIPWTLIPDVPAQPGEYALTQEAFCGVLAEVSLEASDAGEFLAKAVEFANQNLWGNLSCTVLVDPSTQKRWAIQLERAIAQLRYGAIGINIWSGAIFVIPACTWGAFPVNSLRDVCSGIGVIHNTYLFEYPQKSVVYAPFRVVPMPLWFARHGNLKQATQCFTKLQEKTNFTNFLSLVVAALQG
jgi:acyl-CoA reductase-like NAD-dependent aldehyde dehydrogenase